LTIKVSVCLGRDMFGELAVEVLKRENLFSDSIRQLSDIHTGCGFVTLLKNGENMITIDPGANREMKSDMIYEDEEIIKSAKVVMAQLEIPDEPVETVLKLGNKHNCINILDPAPTRRLKASVLEYVDILTPNETEAKVLLGYPPDTDLTINELAEGLLELDIQTILITRGAEGVLLVNQDKIVEIPAPEITSVDPTGAGDCFNGNLAYALSEGWSIEKAVKRAVYAGAYCAEYLGVIDGLPIKNELDKYIDTF